VELNPGDQRAVGIVAQMDRLFEVEAQALQEALSPEDRHSLRLEKSRPLLDTIKSQIEAARSGATAEEHAGKSLQLHQHSPKNGGNLELVHRRLDTCSTGATAGSLQYSTSLCFKR
jgi:hypothetical protein